jgi:hypothetical protein
MHLDGLESTGSSGGDPLDLGAIRKEKTEIG